MAKKPKPIEELDAEGMPDTALEPESGGWDMKGIPLPTTRNMTAIIEKLNEVIAALNKHLEKGHD